MTTLQEIWKHVLDDAIELVATLAIASPLVSSGGLEKVSGEGREVPWFLRRALTGHVILILCRLYDRSKSGPMGDTASIAVLVGKAQQEGKITADQSRLLHAKLDEMTKELESEGVSISDLMSLRNAELAHSVHSRGPLQAFQFWPVLKFAHDTFERILEFETEVMGAQTLDARFHQWQDRGTSFWEREWKAFKQ